MCVYLYVPINVYVDVYRQIDRQIDEIDRQLIYIYNIYRNIYIYNIIYIYIYIKSEKTTSFSQDVCENSFSSVKSLNSATVLTKN